MKKYVFTIKWPSLTAKNGKFDTMNSSIIFSNLTNFSRVVFKAMPVKSFLFSSLPHYVHCITGAISLKLYYDVRKF